MQEINWEKTHKLSGWIGILFPAGVGVAVILSAIIYGFEVAGPGFPLDDAWIHQTFARSLAIRGNWNYSLNSASAGSTSPLWTILLTLGYWIFPHNPYIWTFFLSVIFLLGIAFLLYKTFIRISPDQGKLVWLLGLIIVMEWHLVWSAVSGMETLLFIFLLSLVFYLLMQVKIQIELIGLLAGVLIWVRPDGVTILGPALLILSILMIQRKIPIKRGVWFLVSLFIPIILYGCLNFSISGNFLPNTFFAKTQEYHSLLETPWLSRFSAIVLIPLTGVGAILLPGFFWTTITSVKQRDLWRVSILLWIFGYCVLYSLRLPVVYQHGRYIIPIIPFYLLMGFEGTIRLVNLIRKQKIQQLTKFGIYVSLVVTSIVFIFSGIKAYSQDLLTINKLMVDPAIWIRDATQVTDIIAAHDIGAIGYFSDRKILDLAGLINPDIIPFIREEDELINIIKTGEVGYVVSFSDWYKTFNKLGPVIKEFEIEIDGERHIVEIRKTKQEGP